MGGKYSGGNYPGGNCPESNYPGGNCSVPKLKASFPTNKHTSENKSGDQAPIIKSKSDWEPKKKYHTIQKFIEAGNNDTDNDVDIHFF